MSLRVQGGAIATFTVQAPYEVNLNVRLLWSYLHCSHWTYTYLSSKFHKFSLFRLSWKFIVALPCQPCRTYPITRYFQASHDFRSGSLECTLQNTDVENARGSFAVVRGEQRKTLGIFKMKNLSLSSEQYFATVDEFRGTLCLSSSIFPSMLLPLEEICPLLKCGTSERNKFICSHTTQFPCLSWSFNY